MIGLSLPTPGQPFGWSVCSSELTGAISKLTEVYLVDEGDIPIDYTKPILHAVQGPSLLPLRPNVRSLGKNVGYAFIEEPLLAKRYALNAERHFDHLATGSKWCTDELSQFLKIPVSTIVQGIHERFFKVTPRVPDGKFIVLSAGKAETRKGQDIVVKAMKVFMERHEDVYLSTSWFNPWAAQTPGYENIIVARGLNLPAHRMLGPGTTMLPHTSMPGFYRYADVGFWPNRAEAGTSLPLAESMACGVPAIAAYETGQKDVLQAGDPLNLVAGLPRVICGPDGQPTGLWVEPSVDECIDKLEWAYQHRNELPALGAACRDRMRQFTWERCAQQFLDILSATSGSRR